MTALLVLVLGITVTSLPPLIAAPESAPSPTAVATSPAELSAEQRHNAQLIVSIAQDAGANRDAIIIALMTAMQESSLHNVPFGDRDSRGLFQQRPSQNWGTAEQVVDPAHATEAFLGVGGRSRNPGLFDIENWDSMSKNDAAQAVQRSGYPDLYGRWEPLATQLWQEYSS